MTDDNIWQEKIRNYTDLYNIPLLYLSETLNDPKVIPMIRGKAFEYSTYEYLKGMLDAAKWEVDKPFMNAQSGIHDIDVRIVRMRDSQSFGIECKLAAKGKFKRLADGYEIRVKCMRSRTLGEAMARNLAPALGVSLPQLMVHNDQYLPPNFDFVVTSIANAFYQTDPVEKNYIWAPSAAGKDFLLKLGGQDGESLRGFAFNQMYVATSASLAINQDNQLKCTRQRCADPANCGFIPNYPIIKFDENGQPTNGWVHISKIESLLVG